MRRFVASFASAATVAAGAFTGVTVAEPAHAEIATHIVASGDDVTLAEVRGPTVGTAWKPMPWDDLEALALAAGRYQLRLRLNTAVNVDAVQLPVCAGLPGRVTLDGARIASERPMVVKLTPGSHELLIDVNVSAYEHRIACGMAPRAGIAMTTRGDLGVLKFESPHARDGGGRAVVFVPAARDWKAPGPMLVGAHPWNGDMWTYAAYVELIREAEAKDVVLLMPSGLGNSLYTEDAEDEVMRAVDAVTKEIAIDPRAVSIWGASMGGAGATTIGFHRPDRFASITSYFGDSKYDLSTYVRSLIPDEAAARRVNALDVVDNVRNVPVWLIHGDADRVSPVAQSDMLDAALRARHFQVRFDRVKGMGHEGALVAMFLREVVDVAAAARVPDALSRVTYRSTRAIDEGAYGVKIVRASNKGDAFIDVERKDDGVHVRVATGVKAVVLARGALGTSKDAPPPIVLDDGVHVRTSWE